MFVMSGAYAAQETVQEIQCKNAAPVSQQVGLDLVKFKITGSKTGQLDWINEQNNSDVETGTLTVYGDSKKHPGYTVFSGRADDGSGKVLFALPTDLLGKEGAANFTGYFYSLEDDGGPDVPLGFTMNCSQK